ncbi:hypothetical protein EPO05_02535 [Patescibacteria group bacterium]|nr:MAG: hypothetical protein EPO05_02535 [Patescibacteria group bacterium]
MPESYLIYGVYVSLLGSLLAAGLALLKNSFRVSNWLLLFSTLVGCLVGAAFLIFNVGQSLVIAKLPTLLNATLELNYLSAIFFALVNGVASLVVIFGSEYLQHYKKIYNLNRVQFLTSLFVLGMGGVLLAGNAIIFLFFWEMMSLASFFLVMSDGEEKSVRAAFIYLVMTHLGAAAILGGFLILGNGSLAFTFDGLAAAQHNLSPGMLLVSFLLFLFGFGSKAGLIPFHIWLPAAHPQAPTNISALMSGLMLKIAVYGFLKVVLIAGAWPLWTTVLVMILGIASAFFGALYAVISRDIKRALAYSSIENMGIIFTMLGAALYVMNKNGGKTSSLAILIFAYAIFHALNHAIFKTGLFLSSGVIIGKFHSKSLEVMGGLARVMPLFSGAFLIVILAASALPPFGAFYGEWGFIRALISLLQRHDLGAMTSLIFLVILSLFALTSGLAIFAMVKIFGISMLGKARTEIQHATEDHGEKQMIYPIAILGGVMILTGIFAKDILLSIARGVQAIMDPTVATAPAVAISSQEVFGIFVSLLLGSIIFYKLFQANEHKERKYQTWDCGQPIDASMEYTATAFSAPIRFFFLSLLQRDKSIVATPVVATNRWIAKKSFSMKLTSAWQEKFYKPSSKVVFWLADKIRLIHTGRIQYYLLLLLGTIIVTLMIAL